jgi:hypothetical protein
MKQVVRFQNLVIAGKLRTEVRITIDDRGGEWSSSYNGDKSTAITFLPTITLTLTRPGEIDENGNRTKAPYNINDNLGMSKYNFPIFINELKAIYQDLKITELYTYKGKRLELNEEVASKIRRVFMIGKVTLELSAVVVVQPDSSGEDTRVEGIKMKFNNEQSSVLLTLNEFESLIYNLEHFDIDSVCLLMYLNYISKPSRPRNFDASSLEIPVEVDIQPKISSDFTDLPI